MIRGQRLREDYEALIEKLMLTPRQRRICDAIYLEGKTSLEIAEDLGYSDSTINQEYRKILEKTKIFLSKSDKTSPD